MSVYGLRTYDAYGNILLDIDERLNRVRYSAIVTAGSGDGSVTLSDLSGQTTVEIAIPINVAGPAQRAFEVSRSGNVISWHDSSGSSVDTLIIVFIYV